MIADRSYPNAIFERLARLKYHFAENTRFDNLIIISLIGSNPILYLYIPLSCYNCIRDLFRKLLRSGIDWAFFRAHREKIHSEINLTADILGSRIEAQNSAATYRTGMGERGEGGGAGEKPGIVNAFEPRPARQP